MGLVVDVIGWLGAGALLGAYALASAGRLAGTSAWFQVLNLLGSAGLALNSGYHDAWPSALLNVVWMGIGLAALAHGKARPPRRVP
jgi:hypothetical protein